MIILVVEIATVGQEQTLDDPATPDIRDICNPDDYSGQLTLLLGAEPPQDLYLQIDFVGSGNEQERFLIYSGSSDSPGEYFNQVPSNGQATSVGKVWPGGKLWVSFQRCFGSKWRDYQMNVAGAPAEGGFTFNLDCPATEHPRSDGTFPLSRTTIQWGTNIAVPPEASPQPQVPAQPRQDNTPNFLVTFANYTILEPRSKNTDTNFAFMTVSVGGQSITKLWKSVGDNPQGGPYPVGLAIPIFVPDPFIGVPEGVPRPPPIIVHIDCRIVNNGNDKDKTKTAIDIKNESTLDSLFDLSDGKYQFQGCDGLVAKHVVNEEAILLFGPPTIYPLHFKARTAGTDSPGLLQCNSVNSNYETLLTVTQLS